MNYCGQQTRNSDEHARERDKDQGKPASKRTAPPRLIQGQLTTNCKTSPRPTHHRLPRPDHPLPLTRIHRKIDRLLTRRIRALPDGAMSTLTWDQGSEMARHQRLTAATGTGRVPSPTPTALGKGARTRTPTATADRYLPKGTPITSHQPYLDAIADELNNCPRATRDYLTPQEAFTQLIATTP